MNPGHRIASLAGAAAFLLAEWSMPAAAQNIIDRWNEVKVPPPPPLKSVTVDPKTTALFAFDFLNQSCTQKGRPDCIAAMPQVAKLLKGARDSGAMVVYGMTPTAKVGDIKAEVKPEGNEPVIVGPPDRFLGTNLAKMLKDRGITTVIVTGTSAEGVVLYTASYAAMSGFKVVLPVDCIPSSTPYAEQYVVWNMVHAPTIAPSVTLTTADMVKF